MAEAVAVVAFAASIAGLVSLAIQLSETTQKLILGVKDAPKVWLDLIHEAKSLRTVLINLNDNVLENPDVLEAFEGRASAFQRSLRPVAPGEQVTNMTESTAVIMNQETVVKSPDKAMAALSLRSTPLASDDLLAQCSSDLQLLIDRLMKKSYGNGVKVVIKSFSWPFAENEIRTTLSKLHRYREVFEMSTAIDTLVLGAMTHKIVKASSHDITNIKILQNNQLAQAERDAILQWLSPIDFHATQASILERRHEGTSGWIIALSEFQDYCQGTGQRLWCHGIPGAGKTVIAAILFDYLKTTYGEDETQNIRVTGIYCNYKEADIQSPVNLLASIYFQLVSEDSALPIELERLYSNGKNRLKRMRPTFLEIKSLLAAKISGYSRIFLIVDALDELPENSRRILITTVQTVRPDINLLVTSRYLDNIALDLKDWVKLEIKASRGDIEAYVKHRLSEGNRLEKLVNRDIALKKVVVVTVVEKSLHMFLLAQLHMDSLATKLTPGEISEALSDLPAELYDTYDNALRRIEDQGPSASKLANRILMWISYAGRPLRVTEMQHALAIRPDTEVLDLSFMPEEDDLTSLCAGLVLIDHKRTLRLVHYSMQEYFESIRDTRFPSAQVIITRACLAYISHDIFNACLLQSGAEIESRLRQYPFARYASPYWLTHARASPEEHLIDAILHFVKNPYPVGNYLTIKLRHGPRKALILAPWKEFLIYGHQEQWNTWSKIAFAEGHNLIETATHLSNKVLHNSSIDDVDYGSALIRGICVRVLES